jgi:hypothetical protein
MSACCSRSYGFRVLLTSFLVWLVCLVAPSTVFSNPLSYEEYPGIKLRSLDKITARTLTFDAQVGNTIKFGDIYIKIQSCRKPPPVEKNEAAAFLQIWQTDKASQESRWIFSGWMFSSSPAVSGMEHPVYDVWVIDCIGKDPEAEAKVPPVEGPALPDEGTVPEDSVVQPESAPEEQVEEQVRETSQENDTPVSSEPVTNNPQSNVPAQSNIEDTADDNEVIEGIY